MKALWFSNRAFSSRDATDSGTWLAALGRRLAATGEVELCNVTFGERDSMTAQDDGHVRQWLVPNARTRDNGLPDAATIAGIVEVVGAFAPDIINVWGSESYWGLLTARGVLRQPALLEIQGLKGPCARVYEGGLSARERLACVGLREIVRPVNSIASGRKRFRAWSRFEYEIIAGHRYITTQSPWVESWVRAANKAATTFHTELALRNAFYDAEPWVGNGGATIFCSSAYSAPFKGVHDAVRALALLKGRVPGARLRIAGAQERATGIRRDGYTAWVNRLARSLHVADSIDWLGALTADDIVTELQQCGAVVMPSHCESYCMALAEALYLGAPVVTAHTGGSDWLAHDEESALFYSPGDATACARQLERALTNAALASRLSASARSQAVTRNDLDAIVEAQLQRYRSILDDEQVPAS